MIPAPKRQDTGKSFAGQRYQGLMIMPSEGYVSAEKFMQRKEWCGPGINLAMNLLGLVVGTGELEVCVALDLHQF